MKPAAFPRAPLTWVVIAVLGTGQGIGDCGHQHETADEATLCPWTPDPWPEQCDLLVRQVRADRRGQQAGLPFWKGDAA